MFVKKGYESSSADVNEFTSLFIYWLTGAAGFPWRNYQLLRQMVSVTRVGDQDVSVVAESPQSLYLCSPPRLLELLSTCGSPSSQTMSPFL